MYVISRYVLYCMYVCVYVLILDLCSYMSLLLMYVCIYMYICIYMYVCMYVFVGVCGQVEVCHPQHGAHGRRLHRPESYLGMGEHSMMMMIMMLLFHTYIIHILHLYFPLFLCICT